MKRSLGGWLAFVFSLALAVSTLVAFQHASATRQLVAAVNHRDAPEVEAFLRQGADPNARDWKTYYCSGKTPFRPPWYEKPLARLMRRQPRAADPYSGPTVLMIAARNGDTAIAQSLLNHGADSRRVGTRVEDDGISRSRPPVPPLFETICSYKTFGADGPVVVGNPPGNNVATALLLIRRGAPVNVRASGLTPLMLTDQTEIAAALINNGADVNAVADGAAENDEGKTPLMFAVDPSETSGSDQTDAQQAAVVLLLLNKGAKVNTVVWDGLTPLGVAAVCRLSHIVTLLLAHGANANLFGPTNDPPLICAAKNKDLEMLKALLAHGADTNVRNPKGETALMLASYPGFAPCLPPHSQWRSRRRDMQKRLRQYGADPRLKDRNGHTAFDYESMVDPDQVCGR